MNASMVLYITLSEHSCTRTSVPDHETVELNHTQDDATQLLNNKLAASLVTVVEC